MFFEVLGDEPDNVGGEALRELVLDDVARSLNACSFLARPRRFGPWTSSMCVNSTIVFLVCPALTSASSALPTLKSMALFALC